MSQSDDRELVIDDRAPADYDYHRIVREWVGPPDDLYPRLTDKQDAKGAIVSFRVPEGFERRMDLITQYSRERGLPWPTRTDFLRNAAAWFVDTVAARMEMEDDPLLNAWEHGSKQADKIAWMKKLREQAEAVMKNTVDICLIMLSQDHPEEAKAQILALRKEVAAMSYPLIRRAYDLALTSNVQLTELSRALLEEPK